MTGRDLVTASLRLIGAVAPGETIATNEAVDGLASVNRMIGSWSNEALMVYSRVNEEFDLVAGTQSYTIGTGGTFSTIRPLEVEQIKLKVGSGSTAIEYPIRILSQAEWASITQKGVSSNIVTDAYLEGTYPLETIHLFPNPSSAYKLIIWSLKQLSEIATLDSDISLPPGYEEALVYNAAIRLASEYGRTPNELVFNIAGDSKAALKRTNHKPAYLRADDALITPARFNIRTGDYNR